MGLVSHLREIFPNTGWFYYNKNWRTQTVRNFLCLKGVIFISTNSKLYFYKNDCIWSILVEWEIFVLSRALGILSVCLSHDYGHTSWPIVIKFTQIHEQMVKFLTKITSFYHHYNVRLYLIDLLVFFQNNSVGGTLNLSRMFYINCVSKVKQSPERTNILGDSEDDKSENHLRRAISTRLSWKRKQFILQESLIYFNTSGEGRTRQQLTNHVAELPRDDIFFSFSPSLSLLRRYFQFLAGPFGSLTPFRLTMLCGRYQMCINPPPPPPTRQPPPRRRILHLINTHARPQPSDASQHRFIHFILSHSFLNSFNVLRYTAGWHILLNQ